MRLLLTGASGQLGAYLLQQAQREGQEVVAWSGSRTGRLLGTPLQPVDLADLDRVAAAFRQARPDAVLHAGAAARVADCHREPEQARRVNVDGTARLMGMAEQARARFVLVSTDLVFDGERGNYREDDAPVPLSVYGRTKLEAEQVVLGRPRAAVARCSLMFGPNLCGRPGFFDQMAAALRAGKSLDLFEDEWRTPLSLRAAAQALLALARSDVTGLLHLGGPERLSRLDMGRRLAEFLGITAPHIIPVSRNSVPAAEPRPRDTSLDSSRWRGLFRKLPWPDWEAALQEIAVSGSA